MPGRNVIEVDNVHKSYGEFKAVNGLSFAVSEAFCFGLLGPNGAGKTTMMKMLTGKAQRDNHPDSFIRVSGYDPLHNELFIKDLCGVVPQDNNLDEELNVTENLEIYSRFYGMKRREAAVRINELLNFMDLQDKSKVSIKELSGGMKRRLVIARALLNRPRVLVLDEPTTGLDPQVRHLIWDKLRTLKSEGVTILLTTHYMEEAFQICDSIAIMDHGRKVLTGRPYELIENHIERYVLEVFHPEAAIKASASLPHQVRVDRSGSMSLFYSNDSDALKEIENRVGSGGYYMRQSNLEDLFLKTTGRSLHED